MSIPVSAAHMMRRVIRWTPSHFLAFDRVRRHSGWLIVLAILLVAGDRAPAGEIQEIAWRQVYSDALRESRRSNKSVVVQITAPWCGHCRRMSQQTLANQRIVRQLNQQFIPLLIDADENRQLIDALGVKALPTTIVISPEWKIVKRLPGYQSVEDFQRHLGEVKPKRDGTEEENQVASQASAS